jgi:hypothetical protein
MRSALPSAALEAASVERIKAAAMLSTLMRVCIDPPYEVKELLIPE